jgi:hypothetical protein
VGPALPFAAGPYSTTLTYGGGGASSVTIHSRANVTTQIDAPVTTTVGLSFNGTPGFPLAPVALSAYSVHVQMTESSGAEVFCLDLLVPLRTATPFVTVQQISDVPTLSPASVIMLAAMLFAMGLFIAQRRNIGAPGPADHDIP